MELMHLHADTVVQGKNFKGGTPRTHSYFVIPYASCISILALLEGYD